MKTSTISCLVFLLLASVAGCSKKDDANTHYAQEKDVNSSPAWRVRSVDIRDMDPLEFLTLLQTMELETAQIWPVKHGWVIEADIPKLFALLDSQKKCAPVIAPDWSPHIGMSKPSTVGREAGFLIRFFRSEGLPASEYPVGLGRTLSEADKEDLRRWWAQYQDERDWI